jgi:ribosome-associated translation inhibitor RaiA
MFNPLVDSFDALSNNEIEQTISSLSRKYFQTHNPDVQMQISAILEMYKSEMRVRIAKGSQQQSQDNGDNSLDNLINIS